jgi:putative transposase
MKTFEMRPDMNFTMGEYVVMLNHFQGIIGIGKNEYNWPGDGNHTPYMIIPNPTARYAIIVL